MRLVLKETDQMTLGMESKTKGFNFDHVCPPDILSPPTPVDSTKLSSSLLYAFRFNHSLRCTSGSWIRRMSRVFVRSTPYSDFYLKSIGS